MHGAKRRSTMSELPSRMEAKEGTVAVMRFGDGPHLLSIIEAYGKGHLLTRAEAAADAEVREIMLRGHYIILGPYASGVAGLPRRKHYAVPVEEADDVG
jgi:hypothetical protein